MKKVGNLVEPITYKEFESLVRAFIELATTWQTIIYPYNGPQPGNQYCTVNFSEYDREDHDEEYFEVEPGENEELQLKHIFKGETYVKVEVVAYGDDSMRVLNAVTKELKSANRYKPADNTKINPAERFKEGPLWQFLGYGGEDGVQSASSVFMGKVQPRALLTIYFYANFTEEEVIESFDKVEVGINVINNNQHFDVKIGEKTK